MCSEFAFVVCDCVEPSVFIGMHTHTHVQLEADSGQSSDESTGESSSIGVDVAVCLTAQLYYISQLHPDVSGAICGHTPGDKFGLQPEKTHTQTPYEYALKHTHTHIHRHVYARNRTHTRK